MIKSNFFIYLFFFKYLLLFFFNLMIHYQFKNIKSFVYACKNFNSLINTLYDDLELKKEENIICIDSINNIIINNEEDYQNFLKNKQCHLIIDVKNKNENIIDPKSKIIVNKNNDNNDNNNINEKKNNLKEIENINVKPKILEKENSNNGKQNDINELLLQKLNNLEKKITIFISEYNNEKNVNKEHINNLNGKFELLMNSNKDLGNKMDLIINSYNYNNNNNSLNHNFNSIKKTLNQISNEINDSLKKCEQILINTSNEIFDHLENQVMIKDEKTNEHLNNFKNYFLDVKENINKTINIFSNNVINKIDNVKKEILSNNNNNLEIIKQNLKNNKNENYNEYKKDKNRNKSNLKSEKKKINLDFFEEKKNKKYNAKIIIPNKNIKFTSEEIETFKGTFNIFIQNNGFNPLPEKCYIYAVSHQLYLKTTIDNKIENKKEIKICLKKKEKLTEKKQELNIELCDPEGEIIDSVNILVNIENNDFESSINYKKDNELENLMKYFKNSHIRETEIKQIYEKNGKNFEKTFDVLIKKE